MARTMSEANPRHQQAIASLDGIRAVSVLIVVVAHSGFVIVPGGLGVTIFFFLSGYLITTLMLAEHERTGELDIVRFYARRVFRLMPPLLVTLAIVYGLTFAGLVPGGITLAGLASQLLYFANYYQIFFDPGNTIPRGTEVLWSLAVEEHYYICYPIIMSLLLRNALRPSQIAALLGVSCIAILAWRIHLVMAPDFSEYRTYYASDTRIDSIIYGCILAVIANPLRQSHRAQTMSLGQWAIFAVALGSLLMTLVYRSAFFRETFRYSLQGLALMPIFFFAIRYSGNALFRHLNSTWLSRLGVYSYTIYLIHYVLIQIIVTGVPALAAERVLVFSAAILISIAYAAAIDRFVDPYFQQLRVKFKAKPPMRAAVFETAK
jgi:peptidoglycan/LPS O-acetylase OafA/YrhL